MRLTADIRRFEHEIAEFTAKLVHNPAFWGILATIIVLAGLLIVAFAFKTGSSPQVPYYDFPPFGYLH
ncbi:MAG: hypothetical protein K8R02_01140 [Anaerohalosphaeraceae bacterium]|nr:hypothetical protein [Anaerohalosphaeraceae bacterium]